MGADDLTTKQAAELAGLKYPSIISAIKRNQLPATKHGRDWLIARADFTAWLHGRRKPGRPAKDAP